MIRYKIQGTWWTQERLTYEQILQTVEILKGNFSGFLGNEEALGILIDRLLKEKVLPRLMAILIRPHAYTRPGAWLNDRRLAKKGLTAENICNKMTIPEIAKVLLHFFVLNVSWIQSWMPSLIGSIGTVPTTTGLTADTLLSRLRKLSTTFPTGTSNSPISSGAGTP